MNARTDPDCDYVYKGKSRKHKKFTFSRIIEYWLKIIVVLSGEMGVGKSNIL